jgi:nucleoside phosphorylase/5-methylcytosine-specific restriction endonuclease McrA
MIFIDRSAISVYRPDFLNEFENHPLRQKQLAQIRKAFDTPLAQRKWKKFNFGRGPGSIPDVMEDLYKVFAGKCAYCEVKVDEGRPDTLTFFRPRQNALQELGGTPDPNHYWWLSWEWSNLYLACRECRLAKGWLFPTARKKRAEPPSPDTVLQSLLSPDFDWGSRLSIDLQEEESLLIDPCLDKPVDHLSFEETGKVAPRDGSKRGNTTITILDLNRNALLSERREHARKIKGVLKRSLQATDRNKGEVKPNISSKIEELRLLCGADQPFAGMTRQLLKHWLQAVELKTTLEFPTPSLENLHWQDLISQLQDNQAPPIVAAPNRNFMAREGFVEVSGRTAMSEWPKSLVRAVEKGRVIPFAGSGVAMALRGLDGGTIVPDWRGLLDAAADWLDEEKRPEDADLLRQRLKADPTFAGAFRTAYKELGPLFLDFVQDKLDPPRDAVDDASLELARALWRLSSNFVVTIGHDRALKWGCPDPLTLELIEAAEVPDTVRRLSNGLPRPALWQAFGTLESGGPIFTFDAIRNLLPDKASEARLSATADSLQELFACPYPVLFVATTAPHFFSTQLFKEADGRRHYWLVRQADFEHCRLSLRERDLPMIQPVAFPDYDSLPRLLNELAERRGPVAAAPPPAEKLAAATPPGPPAALGSSKRPDDCSGEAPMTETFDVVIVCALHVPELEKVLKTGEQPWESLSQKRDDPHTYNHTVYTTRKGSPLRVVAAAPNQMGLAASAVLATKMILRFRPKLVAMVGIAAGIETKSQGFGDILAAEHTFDYGAGKATTQRGKLIFKPDPKPLGIHSKLLSRLKYWQAKRTELNDIYDKWEGPKPDKVLRLHVGPLGSGAAVIDTQAPLRDVTKHWRKLIGVEMEAYAVHRACNDAMTPEPMYLCLKSICDFAEKKEDSWQPYAAFTAAQLCHRFLVAEWENLVG